MKNDIIAQQQAKLKRLQRTSLSARNLVTSTINNLSIVNENIDQTICEIEEAKMQLNNTKIELEETRDKNSMIVQKFKNLIGE